MPGSGTPRPPIKQQDQLIDRLNRFKPGEQLVKSGAKCLKCQTSNALTNSISNATGSAAESDSVYRGSAILCSVNSANNTRKLNLILSKSQQQQQQQHPRRGEPLAVGTNLQNKLPASSADCHLSPSAETNIRATTDPPPSPRYPFCPPCPYSHPRRHRHRHSQHHHHHYRHRGCRCRCRCRDASQSASASPASMLLPYQINQRATLLQQSAAATATSTTHVPGAATTALRASPRIYKRKRDTVQTATTASPLTPLQQHPTVAAATSATFNTTTTRRSRLEFILYTEVYEVEEDSISPGDSHLKSSDAGSIESFWHKYGE
ncbi:dual specificity tyrosine-phosphorylation-regulated kinase 1A [Drosophila biarmipes]|uniref:dual specificity tyrosine-phosphorylation-regulated kinase 1A n=1 Tax=Drosophila biarmipes TaxID=125945 RepID=UPI0007E7F235|nr:dual specificity tyrosine-phosphorylation-regulated kinase 1A [Drosophila biarmipes]